MGTHVRIDKTNVMNNVRVVHVIENIVHVLNCLHLKIPSFVTPNLLCAVVQFINVPMDMFFDMLND